MKNLTELKKKGFSGALNHIGFRATMNPTWFRASP